MQLTIKYLARFINRLHLRMSVQHPKNHFDVAAEKCFTVSQFSKRIKS